MQADPPSLYADPFDPANFAPDDSNTARLSGNTLTGVNTFNRTTNLGVLRSPLYSPGSGATLLASQLTACLWMGSSIFVIPNPDLLPNGTFFFVGARQTVTRIRCVDNGTDGGRFWFNELAPRIEIATMPIGGPVVFQSELRTVGTSRWRVAR